MDPDSSARPVLLADGNPQQHSRQLLAPHHPCDRLLRVQKGRTVPLRQEMSIVFGKPCCSVPHTAEKQETYVSDVQSGKVIRL